MIIMAFIQDDRSIKFIDAVKNLVDSGIAPTYVDIADTLEWNRSAMSNVINNRRNVPKDVYRRFIDVYKKSIQDVSHETLANEPQGTYLQKRLQQKNTLRKEGAAIFESLPSTLTTTEVYRDEKHGEPDFWITIPFLRDCNFGTRAKGDSMHPLIRTNALVIGRRIYDFKVIVFGEIYTVITKNNITTTKYIHPHPEKEDWILLVPYNEKAKSTPILKEDILELYEAKAVFNNL